MESSSISSTRLSPSFTNSSGRTMSTWMSFSIGKSTSMPARKCWEKSSQIYRKRSTSGKDDLFVTPQDSSPHVLDKSALYSGSQEIFCCGLGSRRLPSPQQKKTRAAGGGEESGT